MALIIVTPSSLPRSRELRRSTSMEETHRGASDLPIVHSQNDSLRTTWRGALSISHARCIRRDGCLRGRIRGWQCSFRRSRDTKAKLQTQCNPKISLIGSGCRKRADSAGKWWRGTESNVDTTIFQRAVSPVSRWVCDITRQHIQRLLDPIHDPNGRNASGSVLPVKRLLSKMFNFALPRDYGIE